MAYRLFMVALGALLLATHAFSEMNSAATGEEAIVVGTRHRIASTALEGDRFIRVHLPEGHSASSGKSYPVLYLLDGQRYFSHGMGLAKSLGDFGKVPDLIVVGIESPAEFDDRANDFVDNAAAYQRFLKDELLPFMAKRYGAGEVSLLFGWQYAGRMVLNSFMADTALFDTYAMASTWPLDRDFVGTFGDTLMAAPQSNTKLVMAIADNEGVVTLAAHAMKTALEANAGDRIKWTIKEYTDEEHVTTAYRTIALGLNEAFADYRWLRFEDVADYQAFGGIPAVHAYYKARAQKYGTTADVDNETIHRIAMISVREGNLDTLTDVLNAFPGFLERTSAYWLTSFGNAYLEGGMSEKALPLFEIGIKRFPEDADVQAGLKAARGALDKD